MKYLWKEKYLIGISKFDVQHQEIVKLINKIGEAVNDKEKKAALLGVMEELEAYILEHFLDEEQFMEIIGYPRLLEHKLSHSKFISGFLDFRKKIDEEPILATKLCMFLYKWLKEHDQKEDRLYAAFCADEIGKCSYSS